MCVLLSVHHVSFGVCVCVLLLHGCMCSREYSIVFMETWLLAFREIFFCLYENKEKIRCHQNNNSTNNHNKKNDNYSKSASGNKPY